MPPSASVIDLVNSAQQEMFDRFKQYEQSLCPKECTNWISLKGSFARNASFFSIPGAAEAEIKSILPRESSIHKVISHLSHSREIGMAPPTFYKAKNYTLLSFRMDTVDHNGNPTGLVELNNHQHRVRMSYTPSAHGVFNRFDNIESSLKTLWSDGDIRNEFEAPIAKGDEGEINHGLHNLLSFSKYKNIELPSFIEDIASEDMAIESICMSNRAQFYFVHQMPDQRCGVVYEACVDSNRFATPKGTVLVGSDIEFECEAKAIFCSDGCVPSNARRLDILMESMERMGDLIRKADKGIEQSPLSKIQRASDYVARYYEARPYFTNHACPETMRKGIFAALSQGVRPTDLLYDKASPLVHLLKDAQPAAALMQPHWLTRQVA